MCAYYEAGKIPTIVPAIPFDQSRDAQILRAAMKGLGTDEDAIIDILTCRSSDQRQEIIDRYQTEFGRDLVDDLKSELGGKFEKVITALMTPMNTFLARELYDAMDGLGTNEATLAEILCSRDNDSIEAIKAAYEKEFDHPLEEDLQSDAHGNFGRFLMSIASAGRDEGDFDIDLAPELAAKLMEAGEERIGTEECVFNQILATHSYPLLRLTFREYEKLSEKSFGELLDSEISGSLLCGMRVLYDSIMDRGAYYAKALNDAVAGCGTDDRALIRLVISRCEIDLGNIKHKYEECFEKTLEESIENDTSSDYSKALLAVVKGN